MAFGVYTFSRNGRIRLAILLRTLLISQLILSICMIIFCYNSSMHVLLLLKDIHKRAVLTLYALPLLQAYCMKLHSTSGLRLAAWILQRAYWQRTARLCTIWSAVGTLVAINGLLVCVACNITLKALMKGFVASLKVGISQYLTEYTWKKLLDNMQVELSCCGIEKASDWHEIPWINMDYLNEDSEFVLQLAGADGKMLPPVTPYSCCAPNVLAACYHDPLQQLEWHQVWIERDTLAVASLHAVGCVEAVKLPLTRAALALQWFNGLVFLMQLFILILTQLLRTSARDAALRGDCGGPGDGTFIHYFSSKTALKSSAEKLDTGKESTTVLLLERRRRSKRRRAKTPSYPYLS